MGTGYLVFALYILLVVYSLYWFVKRFILKKIFKKKYKLRFIPTSVHVYKSKSNKNYFELHCPFWLYSKSNGTKDLRYNQNYIVWKESFLYFNEYKITTKKTYDMIWLVNQLREQGYDTGLCDEEKKKLLLIEKEKQEVVLQNELHKLVVTCLNNSDYFKEIVEGLFAKQEYEIDDVKQDDQRTLEINGKNQNENVYIYCKIYNLKTEIGGDEMKSFIEYAEDICADKIIYLTNTKFSSQAKSLANKTFINLIDGKSFITTLGHLKLINIPKVCVEDKEYQLSKDDIKKYIPEDIFEKFFKKRVTN